MLIEIKKDVFEDADFRVLNYLIQIAFYKNRYSVAVALEEIKTLTSFNRLDDEDRAIIEETYEQLILEESRRADFIISNQNDDNFFELNEAIRFLIQPVSVILENNLNDAYFLKAIIPYFDTSNTIQKHLDNGWLQFENAGGCDNIRNFINGKLQSYNNLPKENHGYLRCFVMMDSDKKFPTDVLKSNQNRTIDFLNNHQIKYYILHKRNTENYMPIEAFNELDVRANESTHLEDWISVYSRLTEAQKDYFNISKGLTQKKLKADGTVHTRSDLDTEIQELYADVSDEDFNILDRGIHIGDFKTKFPKLFESEPINRETLLARIAHQNTASSENNEFTHILDQIHSLL